MNMKNIMLMAAAFSFYGLSAQEFDDNDSQEVEVLGAAENAVDVGPNDVAAEKEDKKQNDDVAHNSNENVEIEHEVSDTEE